MKPWVGVTDKSWFEQLSALAPDEVNFWQPSGSREFKGFSCATRRCPSRLHGMRSVTPELRAVIPATGKPERQADNLKAGFGPLLSEKQRKELVELMG